MLYRCAICITVKMDRGIKLLFIGRFKIGTVYNVYNVSQTFLYGLYF